MKPSSPHYSNNTLHYQVEEDENLMYGWIDRESKTSKTSETEALEKIVLQCEQEKENI